MSKTLSEGRKPGSGRKKGFTQRETNAATTIPEVLKIKAGTAYGPQVKPYRINMRLTTKEFSDKAGIDFRNITKFENAKGTYSGQLNPLPDVLTKYLKGLGVKQIIIEL